MLVENSGGGGGNNGEGRGSSGGGSGGGVVGNVSKTGGVSKTSMTPTRFSLTSSSSSKAPPAPTTPSKTSSGALDAQLMYTPPHVLIRSISSLSQHSLRPSTPEPDQVL